MARTMSPQDQTSAMRFEVLSDAELAEEIAKKIREAFTRDASRNHEPLVYDHWVGLAVAELDRRINRS